MKKIFSKPALSLTQQVSLLESRGLLIPNKDAAIHYLSFNLLLTAISKNNNWPNSLSSLLQNHPWIPIKNMGFAKHWEGAVFWKLSVKTAAKHDLILA